MHLIPGFDLAHDDPEALRRQHVQTVTLLNSCALLITKCQLSPAVIHYSLYDQYHHCFFLFSRFLGSTS